MRPSDEKPIVMCSFGMLPLLDLVFTSSESASPRSVRDGESAQKHVTKCTECLADRMAGIKARLYIEWPVPRKSEVGEHVVMSESSSRAL